MAATSETFDDMKYPIIVDSGAAESVLPTNWCPQAAIIKGPKYGAQYSAANGGKIKNEGERTVTMVTRDEQWCDFKFQVADIARPLASVDKLCEAGHSVVFNPSWDKRGSYILDPQDWTKTWLTRQDGVFVLETKVAPTRYQSTPSMQGFTRRGR